MEFGSNFSPEKKRDFENNEEWAVKELRKGGEKSEKLKKFIDKK